MILLLDAALKGSILIAAAALVAYFLRGRSAAARHAAWTAAVVGHLALPIFGLVVPQWTVPILPVPSWASSPAPQIASTRSGTAPAPSTVPVSAPVTASVKSEAPAPVAPESSPQILSRVPRSPASVVMLLWTLGTLVVLLRLAVGTWKVGRLARKGDRVDDGEWLSLTQRLANRLGITRPLTLLRGDKLAVPVTWGVVYPAVLLPPDSLDWPEERRRFVLVHEMAHVKRFDALTQLIAQIAIAVFWFDPLIWIAAHRMRVEREHACDDYVIRDGTKPSLYAGELLEMVQSIGLPRHESAAPAFAALAMARRSEFEGRMLAILDARQDRQTLGRRSAIAAITALALLVLPLAALRPFQSSKVAATAASVVTPSPGARPSDPIRRYSDTACDSAMNAPRRGANLVNLHNGDGGHPVLEYLSISADRCAQAAFVGKTTFANDRLIALGDNAYVMLREMTRSSDRSMLVTPRSNGTLEFSPRISGRPVPYDDSMRVWFARFMPEVLTEGGVAVAERVARDMARGGVDAVLSRIGNIASAAARRAHYEALLDGKPLADSDYDRVSRHAARSLAPYPEDLSVVLTRIAAGPASGTKGLGRALARLSQAQETLGKALSTALDANATSTDSARTLTRYGTSDDPEMMLLALRGAKDISSDTDKRILLQTLAAGALRRNDPELRKAFFAIAESMESDTDLRVSLMTALPFGHSDPLVTSNVLRLVRTKMSSDMERRVTLVTAVEQKLITSPKLRDEFMAAAKSIQSSDEYRVVMQAAFKQ
jgi:beta-lactamase regulating signal transducer with metallopeptidase domain